jgi:PAS domain-containing protein
LQGVVGVRVASDVQAAELAILNAPFEENGWARATLAVAEATRSAAAQLIGFGGPKLLPLNVVVGDIGGPTGHLCNAHLYGPCNWRINSVGPAMSIQHEVHYRAYAASHDTADYDDAVSDVDLPFGCQSALAVEPDRLIGLSLLRRRRDGRCDEEVLGRFAYLRTHVSRAIRMQLALDNEAAQLMLGHLETVNCATLLLDSHGILAEMTQAAEPLFDLDGPLRLIGLAVRLVSPVENRQFERLLADLLHDDVANPCVAEMRVAGGAGMPQKRWRLIASRLPRREHGLGFEPRVAITLRPLQPA